MTSIPAVAFASINPEALRVFLDMKGYVLRVVLDDASVLDQLDPARKNKNVVILPNFSNLGLLAEYQDRIGFLLLLTNGRHEAIVDVGVPILDATVQQDGTVHRDRPRTAHWYIETIERSAVPLEIKTKKDVPVGQKSKVQKSKVKTPKGEPTTLDQWFDFIDQSVTAGLRDFSVDIEYPVGLYLMGESSREDFQNAMKTLVARGAEQKVIRRFYRWLSPDMAARFSKALRLYCWPKDSSRVPDVTRLATKFRVSHTDIQLIDAIYSQMQKGDTVDEQEE